MTTHRCAACGASFTPARPHYQACSKACRYVVASATKAAKRKPEPERKTRLPFLARDGAIVSPPEVAAVNWRTKRALAELPAEVRERLG